MSKKGILGGVIMVLLVLLGLFGEVTFNGEVVENRIVAFLVAVVLMPLFLVAMGFVFNFLKDCIVTFLSEMKKKFFKKVPTETLNTNM